MKNASIIRAAKDFAKYPYAFPGGYPLMLVMHDGECMCSKCTRENFALIGRSTRDESRDGWVKLAEMVGEKVAEGYEFAWKHYEH